MDQELGHGRLYGVGQPSYAAIQIGTCSSATWKWTYKLTTVSCKSCTACATVCVHVLQIWEGCRLGGPACPANACVCCKSHSPSHHCSAAKGLCRTVASQSCDTGCCSCQARCCQQVWCQTTIHHVLTWFKLTTLNKLQTKQIKKLINNN